jgi:molybdenum cofactor cytidylyltransferase
MGCGDGRRPDVVVPTVEGRRGNPLRWDRRQFQALAGLSGDAGARTILGQQGLDILVLECGDPGIVEDFDTVERLAVYRAAC